MPQSLFFQSPLDSRQHFLACRIHESFQGAIKEYMVQAKFKDANQPLAVIKPELVRITDWDQQLVNQCMTRTPKGAHSSDWVPGQAMVGRLKAIAFPEQDQKLALHWQAALESRILAYPSLSCGHCLFCRGGVRQHCSVQLRLGLPNEHLEYHESDIKPVHQGTWTDELCIPLSQCHGLPINFDGILPDEKAIWLMEIARFITLIDQLLVGKQPNRILVIGSRLSSLLLTKLFQNKTAHTVHFASFSEDILELADRFELSSLSHRQLNWRKQYELVIDTTSTTASHWLSCQLAAPRGRIVNIYPREIPYQADLAKISSLRHWTQSMMPRWKRERQRLAFIQTHHGVSDLTQDASMIFHLKELTRVSHPGHISTQAVDLAISFLLTEKLDPGVITMKRFSLVDGESAFLYSLLNANEAVTFTI